MSDRDEQTKLLQEQPLSEASTPPDGFEETEEPVGSVRSRRSLPVKLQETDQAGQYLLTSEDAELLKEVLRHNVHLKGSGIPEGHRFRFRDLEFTRQLSTFDRQNPNFSSSEFHGFFTLFWLGVALLLVKVAANNWRTYGTIWGKNEIVRLMFHKDVLILGLTDLVLCWSTFFCLGLQRAILHGYLRWSGMGWVIQNVCQRMNPGLLDLILLTRWAFGRQIWQSAYLAGFIWWTYHRDWPWTHTVFMVLHCLTMLMKQHSYAAYNGYCKSIFLPWSKLH